MSQFSFQYRVALASIFDRMQWSQANLSQTRSARFPRLSSDNSFVLL